ncbi:AAA family ATPase [Actinoplanes sp. NPDC049802]|uniref:AAA family ATPase n=1 Tax=Actinoplanes sp. NPDC049802 TaxID=3154742 RepID=UPI0033EDD39A
MALIEREHLLTELTTTYRDAAAGRGRAVLVDGGVASGKTTLVNAVAEHAANAGALVLSACGSVAESRIRLGVIGQLLHSLRTQNGLPVHPGLPGAGPQPADPPAGTLRPDDARLIEGICRVLLDNAAGRPLVVLVDDVHFADPLSLHALLYLQRRIRPVRLLLMLSGCAGSGPGAAAFRAELDRQSHCRHLRLRSLSPEGVGRLLARRILPEAARRLAGPVHEVSAGNPMLADALLTDSLAAGFRTGADGDPAPTVGESFVQAALACLHRSDPRLRDVARALAVAGPEASIELVAGLLEAHPSTVRQILAALGETGPTVPTAYHHPAVRAAVLDDCPAPELGRLRRRAARLLHDGGRPPSVVAEHLVAIGEPVEPWAVPVLVAAVTEDGASARTVACLEAVLSSIADPRARSTAAAAVVRAHWRIGPAAVPGHLCALLESGRDGHLAERDGLMLARSLAWFGRADDAAEILAVVGDLDGHPDPDLAADHRATHDFVRHCRPSGTAAADTRPDPGRAAEVLERAGSDDPLPMSVWHALRVLVHHDRVDQAADWCDRLLADGGTPVPVGRRAVLADVRAAIALHGGDLAAAERHARDALATMPAEAWGIAVGSPLAHLVTARTLSGRLDRAAETLREPTPAAMCRSLYWPAYLRARGIHLDAADRPLAALADFEAAGNLAMRWGADHPSTLPWRIDLARMHVRMGNPEQARKLITDHLARPGADTPRARGLGLRALAAAYPSRQRPAMLREAMDLLQAGGDRHELACAFADMGQAVHALGESGRAKMIRARALRLAEDCHAGLLRQRLKPSPEPSEPPAGETERGPDALSDAERRVVNLAVRGHTNREISHELFITVSTVEQHLTRAYRKLKISRRTELVAIDPR